MQSVGIILVAGAAAIFIPISLLILSAITLYNTISMARHSNKRVETINKTIAHVREELIWPRDQQQPTRNQALTQQSQQQQQPLRNQAQPQLQQQLSLQQLHQQQQLSSQQLQQQQHRFLNLTPSSVVDLLGHRHN